MKRALALTLILLTLCPCLAFAQTYPSLKPGDGGDAVRAVQTRLIELGLLNGRADGDYGDRTAAAVKEAQRLLAAAGYSVTSDGNATPETQILLFDERARDALTTLRVGSRGDAVKALQGRLIDLKMLSGAADGVFGSGTESAVLAFQERMIVLGQTGIAANGAANEATQELLWRDLSQYGFAAPIYFNEAEPLSLTADYLYAPSCVLIDALTGETLFEHRADERRFPASTTKIMTLLIALEYGHLDETVIVPKCAADIPEDSSRVPVYPGEKMRRIDLMYGLMLRSGNDAANAVAELTAGSVDKFVARMNEKAAQLGMSGTHFVNPHGYHAAEHYTTARDLAKLTRMCLTNTAFCGIATCRSYEMPATSLRDSLMLSNPYEILNPDSEFFIPGAAGVKSGYTSNAGFCYVGAFQREGKTLIAVVLGVPTRNRAWMDMRRLFAYGLAK